MQRVVWQACVAILIVILVVPMAKAQRKDRAYQIHHHDFHPDHIKPIHPVRRAEIQDEEVILYERPEFVSAEIMRILNNTVVGVYARADMPLESAWGRVTYWFDIGAMATHGWVWGSQINFLRIYGYQVPELNAFIKTLSKKVAAVFFTELAIDADLDLEVVLHLQSYDRKGEMVWIAVLLDRRTQGFTEVARWIDKTPMEIWVEDVDLDRQEDLIVSYGSGGVQGLDIYKDVGGTIRAAFNREIMRYDRSCQIALRTQKSGVVDVYVYEKSDRTANYYTEHLFRLSDQFGSYVEVPVEWISIWTEQEKKKGKKK